jgi:diphosphomevalonate decarboxylase
MKIEAVCPSNIALVKYWGKEGVQLPMNPSVSLTLSESKTITELAWKESQNPSFSFLFEGEKKPGFEPKIQQFLERIAHLAPELQGLELEISSRNTFPHSSGIASSASAFGALSLAIAHLLSSLRNESELDRSLASEMARLGSGSACRSLFPIVGLWGKHPAIEHSSNQFAIGLADKTHPIFKSYKDYILLIDEGVKSVSSTAGHNLMNGHPFAEARKKQAFEHCLRMTEILESGDLDEFIRLTELEALTLHALMLSASTPYLLMRPNTVAVLEEVKAFRDETKIPICFTLDAGANVHLLFPDSQEQNIDLWVNDLARKYSANAKYLCDTVGTGAESKWIE